MASTCNHTFTDAVSVHLTARTVELLLIARGWTIEPFNGGNAYVKPGCKPVRKGGKCSPDYLWHPSEALAVALGDEARQSL